MRGKLIAVVIAVVILGIFNATSRPIKSKEQKAFDTWLQSIESSLSPHSKELTLNEPISLTISSKSDQRKFSWDLSTIEGGERTEQVLRLLRLAREGELFSRGDNKSGVIVLKVGQGDKSFETQLTEDFVSRNPQAGNFVKLFELFASSKNFGSIGGSV